MKIDRKDKAELEATIVVTVEKSDYESDLTKQLAEKQKTVALKGFRKGKTPKSFIQKVYGNELLANIVNKTVMDSLYKYIEDEKLLTIGNPIPSEEHKDVELDAKSLGDYDFAFDIGMAPEFEVKGSLETDSYEKLIPQVPSERIDEEMTRMKRMFGSKEQVESKFTDGDAIMLHGFEQEDGVSKVAGKEVNFSVLFEDLSEDNKKIFAKSKKGDKHLINVYELEKDRTKEFVDKYLIKLEEGEECNPEFQMEIVEVNRVLDAELNPDFFDKVFRDQKVTSEEEARGEIEKQLAEHYKADATGLMYRGMMNSLVENNEFPLPNSFIERWLFEGKEALEAEEKEKQLGDALKEIKWSVIRSKLSRKFDVKIEEQDIVKRVQMKAGQMTRQYGLGANYVQEITKMIMQNEREMQQIYLEIETEKMFGKMEEHVKVSEKSMTFEDYEKTKEELLADKK